MQFGVSGLVRSVGLAVAAMSCALAQAGTVVQEQGFGLSLAKPVVRTEIGNGIGGLLSSNADPTQTPLQALTFDNFDTALGTLTAVTFWLLDSTGSTVLSIVNRDSAFSPEFGDGVDVSADGLLTRSLSGVPTLAPITKGTPISKSGCSLGAPLNCTGTSSDAPANTSAAGQSLATASFIGPGTFTINAGLTVPAPTLSYNPAPDCTSYSASLDGTWSGKVKIQYTYDARVTGGPNDLPEPTSLYLVGGALLAAGWLRRRRLT